RKSVGAFDRERVEVLEKHLLKWRGKFLQRKIRLAAAADGFVIHVGQVHYALDGEAARFEMALEQIFEKISAKITDMRAAVHGRSACVCLHHAPRRIERAKFLQLAR